MFRSRLQYERKIRENKFLIGEVEELKRELKNVRGYTLPRKLMKAKSTTTTIEDLGVGAVEDGGGEDDTCHSKMEFTIGEEEEGGFGDQDSSER